MSKRKTSKPSRVKKHIVPTKLKSRFHGVSNTAPKRYVHDWKFVYNRIVKKAEQERFLRHIKPEIIFKGKQRRKS